MGAGNSSNFTACVNATNQIGNAIKLSASGDTNSTAYIVYYFDSSNPTNWLLCRRTNGVAQIQIVAQNLTNTGTWRAPMDELIPIGPVSVSVQLPAGVRGKQVRLLVSKATAKAVSPALPPK